MPSPDGLKFVGYLQTKGIFMGLFDGILGGVVGAGMVSVISGVLEQHGGVQGVVDQFEKQGLGPTVKSWVGTGQNLPITAAQIQQALGSDTVRQLAAKAGISVDELNQKLAQYLPQAVDKLTPGGVVAKT
jgi:uncharacterized protein YidB (DUF937 family)